MKESFLNSKYSATSSILNSKTPTRLSKSPLRSKGYNLEAVTPVKQNKKH